MPSPSVSSRENSPSDLDAEIRAQEEALRKMNEKKARQEEKRKAEEARKA